MTTINLPVRTMKNIVNIDDPKVIVPIEDAFEYINTSSSGEDKKIIRGMETTVILKDKTKNLMLFKVLDFKHDINIITKIRKMPILNSINVTYYRVLVRYFNDKEIEMVIPSYVKFYSATTRRLVPIEYVSKSDILFDWQGFNAQVRESEEIDFKPTDYWNLTISSPNDVSMNFYYNGILGYVSYINFNKEKVSE